MRRFYSKMLFLLVFFVGYTSVYSQTIYIKSIETSVDSLRIEAIKKMTFSSGQLIAEMSGDRIINFELADLRFMTCSSVYATADSVRPAFDVLAYPNPVNDLLNLEVETSGDAVIKIFTTDGRIINAPTTKYVNSTYQINVSALKSGCYFCSVQTADSFSTIRFVKFE